MKSIDCELISDIEIIASAILLVFALFTNSFYIHHGRAFGSWTETPLQEYTEPLVMLFCTLLLTGMMLSWHAHEQEDTMSAEKKMPDRNIAYYSRNEAFEKGSCGKIDLLGAASVLCIIPACLFMLLAVVDFGVLAASSYFWRGSYYQVFLSGTFEVLACFFGLLGGVSSLRRKHFVVTMAGASISMFTGLAAIFTIGVGRFGPDAVVAIIPVAFSALTVLIVSISRKEFVGAHCGRNSTSW